MTSYSNGIRKIEDRINDRIYPYKIKHEFIPKHGYNLMLLVLSPDRKMYRALGFVRSPFNVDDNGNRLFVEGLLRDELVIFLSKLNALNDQELLMVLNLQS